MPTLATMPASTMVAPLVVEGGIDRRSSAVLRVAALDNLVEFTPVQPNASTLGAVVDFNALPFAHDEIDFADGARKPLF